MSAVRIRLQRKGRKGHPFYWIVAAASRTKRDGRFIEKLGTYDPNTNPASISVDRDIALKWISFGAKPTNTARAILSYTGVLFKQHLMIGVKKGALTEEVADKKFEEWLKKKRESIQNKKDRLDTRQNKQIEERLKAEREISKRRVELAEEQKRSDAEHENEKNATPAEDS